MTLNAHFFSNSLEQADKDLFNSISQELKSTTKSNRTNSFRKYCFESCTRSSRINYDK